MKAIAIRGYGSVDVLRYEDLPTPQIKSDQLLVKVHASSVNPVDWKIRQGMLQLITGYSFPKILGFDLSGEVVEVGSAVKRFQPGDSIYACLSGGLGGAYAEYAAVSERVAALKPANMTYEEAASLPVAAGTSLQALRDLGNIQPLQRVLINGASGGVGIFAVQLAKIFGAEVTAVCSSKNFDLVKSLGADSLIDYKQQDFTQDAARYDIIFDAVAKQSFSSCKEALKPNGIYINTLPSPDIFMQGVFTALIPGKKAKFILLNSNTEDFTYLKDLIEAGKMRTVIDRTFPLQDLAAAHTYSESGRTVGKIAIAIG